MKKFLSRMLLPALLGWIVVGGALITGLLANGYNTVNVVMAAHFMKSNWHNIFTTTILVGLFFCFIGAQLLLVRRVRHVTTK